MGAAALRRDERWIPRDTFGRRLRVMREDLGISKAETMAKACGVSVRTWLAWENDERPNGPQGFENVVRTIVEVTNIDPAWLMFGQSRDIRWSRADELDLTRLEALPDVADTQLALLPRHQTDPPWLEIATPSA